MHEAQSQALIVRVDGQAFPDPVPLIAPLVAKPSLITHHSSSAFYCSFSCHSDASALLLHCNALGGHTTASLVDNAPTSFRSSVISFPFQTASFPDQVARLLHLPPTALTIMVDTCWISLASDDAVSPTLASLAATFPNATFTKSRQGVPNPPSSRLFVPHRKDANVATII